MNIFVQLLASDSVDPEPRIAPTKFDVEDNVGEGVHIHLRNLRIDMTIDDYERFVDNLVAAQEKLNRGNR